MSKKDIDLKVRRQEFVQTKVLILISRDEINSVSDALRYIADNYLFCSFSLIKKIYKGVA